MDIFDVLTMIGGLCLFLFGMNVMGNALERRAGSSLRSLLQKLTGSKTTGFLTGLGVTSVIQSSSATTVMVVGFVNSGLMTLKQAIDGLKEQLRLRHILRLQKGQCSIVAGFVWSDLLTGLERTSDHCSNVAGCVLDMARNNLNIHQSLRAARTEDPQFAWRFSDYAMKYALPQAE